MGAVTEHVKVNAKAYTGFGTALVSQPLAEHVANILMWGIGFLGVVMPDNIQVSARYILVAAVTGLAVRWVSNTPATP